MSAQLVQSDIETIAIAADHNGVEMKGNLVKFLSKLGYRVNDLGSHGPEVVDYPFLCVEVCRQVTSGAAQRGIVIGGSGQGESIACNKVQGIRAGLCSARFDVEISRGNNDSNVLVLAARIIDQGLARELAQLWLETAFRGGIHQRRVELIAMIEKGEELI